MSFVKIGWFWCCESVKIVNAERTMLSSGYVTSKGNTNGSCNRSNTVMLTDAGKWSITRHLSVEITQVRYHTLSSHFKMHVKDYLRHYDNMLATVVGLLKSIYIYTHHTLSRSIYSLPPPMLSSTSITPSVKSYKMLAASSQDFRVDHTWYRSQHFTLISVLRRRKVAACLTYFWLIFAMAFDGVLQFGLGNC